MVAHRQLDAAAGRRCAAVSSIGPPPCRSALATRLSSACALRSGSARIDRAARDRDLHRERPVARGGAVPAGGALEQVLHVDRLRPQRQPALVRARQHQQVVGQPAEPPRVLERRLRTGAQALAVAAQRHLELRLQHGQRRAQLVAGVRDEPALALDRRLEPVEQLVERLAEPVELVAGVRQRQPLGQVAVGDAGGAGAHALDRPQRRARDLIAGVAREQQRAGERDRQQQREPPQLRRAAVERLPDDRHERPELRVADRERVQPRPVLAARDARAGEVARLRAAPRARPPAPAAARRRSRAWPPAARRPAPRAARSARRSAPAARAPSWRSWPARPGRARGPPGRRRSRRRDRARTGPTRARR